MLSHRRILQFVLGLIVLVVFVQSTVQTTAQNPLYAQKVSWVGSIYLYALKPPPTPIDVVAPMIQLHTLGAIFSPQDNLCSCVSYARKQSPKSLASVIAARDIKSNTTRPTPGAWALLNTGNPYGHVAVVSEVLSGEIKITEANWKPCERTERIISVDDPSILGYYD